MYYQQEQGRLPEELFWAAERLPAARAGRDQAERKDDTSPIDVGAAGSIQFSHGDGFAVRCEHSKITIMRVY